MKKIKKNPAFFVQGTITPESIADSLTKHQSKHEIGAHSMFMGQVRGDLRDGKNVAAIEYSSYEEMANKEFEKIKEEAFAKFDLTCMHIKHSLGRVETGELSFFVFISSPHRKSSMQAIIEVVDRIKAEVPIWKKEFFEDGTFIWTGDVQQDVCK